MPLCTLLMLYLRSQEQDPITDREKADAVLFYSYWLHKIIGNTQLDRYLKLQTFRNTS